MIEIKNRYDESVIETIDADTLCRADLYRANLYRANLYEADLREANLREANLREANLREAKLYGANLYEADLYRANLYRANLYEADLREANLHGANLREANLREANLHGADLHGADLYEAQISNRTLLPAPTMMLLANWGEVSDDLTRDLMILDGWCYPDPQRFTDWANGGKCPYDNMHIQRAANFTENKELWPKNEPLEPKSPYVLMMRLIKECCDWSDE